MMVDPNMRYPDIQRTQVQFSNGTSVSFEQTLEEFEQVRLRAIATNTFIAHGSGLYNPFHIVSYRTLP